MKSGLIMKKNKKGRWLTRLQAILNLCGVLCGLCAYAAANTSLAMPVQSGFSDTIEFVETEASQWQKPLIENDSIQPIEMPDEVPNAAIDAAPEGFVSPAVIESKNLQEAVPASIETLSVFPEKTDMPAVGVRAALNNPQLNLTAANTTRPARIALLLPLNSAGLRQAAIALRKGFEMAYQAAASKDVTFDVIETDEETAHILAAYATAVASYDIIIGPLTRSSVAALAQKEKLEKPTLALTQPDMIDLKQTDSKQTDPKRPGLPDNLLLIGLSIEDEARQIANLASAEGTPELAFVISTETPWQRRAAKAFAAQWQSLGLAQQSITLEDADKQLGKESLQRLQQRIEKEKPALLFIALSTYQAFQLRAVIGNTLPIFGTSQLNPLLPFEKNIPASFMRLNDVRLADIPWQFNNSYPRAEFYRAFLKKTTASTDNPVEKRSADLERLYALGVDAYSIALEVLEKNPFFQMDGLTGHLSVDFGHGSARFERLEQPAIYKKGVVVPLPR